MKPERADHSTHPIDQKNTPEIKNKAALAAALVFLASIILRRYLTKPDQGNIYPYPQYPHAETLKALLYALGFITDEGAVRSQGSIITSPRPLAIRGQRAQLYQEVSNARQADDDLAVTEAILEAKKYDQITDQFLNKQRRLEADLGRLGTQCGRYVILNLESDEHSEVHRSALPPIFLLPGISGDIENTGKLGIELAVQGRTVIPLGYPDSWHGYVTAKFAQAVKERQSYETHGDFFHHIILDILRKHFPHITNTPGTPIELWGHSTGAVIVAELLRRPEFQAMTSNAVLCCPASCIDQRVFRVVDKELPMPVELALDYAQTVLDLKNYPGLNPSNPTIMNKSQKARGNQVASYNALRSIVLKKYPWWNGITVQDSGKIVVVSTEHDFITQSKKVANQIVQENPQIQTLTLPGNHSTPLVEPERVIKALTFI